MLQQYTYQICKYKKRGPWATKKGHITYLSNLGPYRNTFLKLTREVCETFMPPLVMPPWTYMYIIRG
jgi:hypothetical protein